MLEFTGQVSKRLSKVVGVLALLTFLLYLLLPPQYHFIRQIFAYLLYVVLFAYGTILAYHEGIKFAMRGGKNGGKG